MQVIIATEAHFSSTPDGTVHSDTGGRGYEFWAQYLNVFDSVLLLARVSPATKGGARTVEGPGVSLIRVPGYRGPVQYVRHRASVRQLIRNAYRPGMACIARVPGAVGGLLIDEARLTGRPYALEVVGDPHDAFASGAIRHPLRSFLRSHFTSRMRDDCANAAAVAYVTAKHLQQRYPPGADTFSTNFSSVQLPPEAFVTAPRREREIPSEPRLIHIGTHSQWYKGQDVLLRALAVCARQGWPLNLTLVGDGKHSSEFRRLAENLELSSRVSFLGQLPSGEAVRMVLDQADLFVMPSRTEGLPRAMLEAMARGLPCIGSNVGGIPELLSAEDLFEAADPNSLARKIIEVVSDPARLAEMSARNLATAEAHASTELQKRRIDFYEEVQRRTTPTSLEC